MKRKRRIKPVQSNKDFITHLDSSVPFFVLLGNGTGVMTFPSRQWGYGSGKE
jgi:hypothetical protein